MAAAMLCSKVEMKPNGYVGGDPLTAREQEIARSREEMLALLCSLPETEYELSFTDLVERSTPTEAVDDGEKRDESTAEGETPAGPSKGGEKPVKERRGLIRRASSERRPAPATAAASCREGVLLNVYFPSSLTRSLTESRARRATRKRASPDDSIKRDKQQRHAVGCWSAIFWERGTAGRGKARPRQ